MVAQEVAGEHQQVMELEAPLAPAELGGLASEGDEATEQDRERVAARSVDRVATEFLRRGARITRRVHVAPARLLATGAAQLRYRVERVEDIEEVYGVGEPFARGGHGVDVHREQVVVAIAILLPEREEVVERGPQVVEPGRLDRGGRRHHVG